MSAPPAPPACRLSRRNYTPHVTVARLRGTSSESVATYLERQGGFFSEPFEVSPLRAVLLARLGRRRAHVVEAAYPLDDLGAAFRPHLLFAHERGEQPVRRGLDQVERVVEPLGAAEEGIGHVLGARHAARNRGRDGSWRAPHAGARALSSSSSSRP